MPNILNLSVDQLRAMDRASIRASIGNYFQAMTKRQMMAWLLDIDTVPDAPKDTYENGKIVRRVEYERDVETGAKIKGRITTWTYYPNGEINVIRIAEIDANDAEINHIRIKHYLDGRQPKITELD